MDPRQTAQLLLQARASHLPVDWQSLAVPDTAFAYAVQDATLAALGPIGGWKVGARGDGSEPSCAPLPASGVLASGARLDGATWRLRALEVELAFRVGRDLSADALADTLESPEALKTVFDAVLPAIEVVETRLGNPPCTDPAVGLADLLSHGALVIGAAVPLTAANTDLRSITATLALDGQEVARLCGANPAGDAWSLLAWLVRRAAARGLPLKQGQIVTTGSCTGVQHAQPGQQVRGELLDLGAVSLSFGL